MQRVLVLGGGGSLGRVLCSSLQSSGYIPISVDLIASPTARASYIISPNLSPTSVASALRAALASAPPLAAIIVTAGAWEGGNASNPSFLESYERLNHACLTPALVGATLAASTSTFLSPGGLFLLTGAAAVLDDKRPPSGMLAYALVKNATHALIRGVGGKGGGLSKGTCALALAPHTIDTRANRESMPKGDFNKWTKPEILASQIISWIDKPHKRPASGTIVEVQSMLVTLSDDHDTRIIEKYFYH
jgi:NAD(P)-dependent dehydrogenase (short-subunit alcohol dehydrogenase family)